MKRAMKKKQKNKRIDEKVRARAKRADDREFVFTLGPPEPDFTDEDFTRLKMPPLSTTLPLIREVSYGETFNTGNYTSRRIDATAEVSPSKTPEYALRELREWVQARNEEMDAAALDFTDEDLKEAQRIVRAAELKARR
jgi:hypothetical protein